MTEAMINMLNIEYDLEESLVTGLRATFMYDDTFTYNEDLSQSKCIITSSFPEKEQDIKIPHIVVVISNLSISKTSLSNNFYDVIIEEGIQVGEKYASVVPYSASIICIANKDGEAKDLASKVLDYLSFTATDIFEDVLGLNIQNYSKSAGSPYRQMPDKAFAHTVNISGTANWIGEKRNVNNALIQQIKLEIIKK